jgi:hypothetical protein
MRSRIICIPYPILCGKIEKRDGRGIWGVWGKRGVHRVLVGKTNGKRPLEDPDVDGRKRFRWIFRKLDGIVKTGWSCLRIETVVRRL